MLQAGAKPAIRDRKGRSALDYANEKGFHKIVELLQAAEANDR
jgi:ankyrin repeat protein